MFGKKKIIIVKTFVYHHNIQFSKNRRSEITSKRLLQCFQPIDQSGIRYREMIFSAIRMPSQAELVMPPA